jgi:hypothetical protein
MESTKETSHTAAHEEGDSPNVTMIENRDLNDPEQLKAENANLKLDKHGLPLVPQPTDHKDDPLVNSLSFSDNQV